MSRIVLHTFGSLGDLHPYLAVGRTLSARGHHVVVATHPEYRARVEAEGLAHHDVPPALADVAGLDAVMRAAMHERDGSRYVLTRLCLPFVGVATDALLAAARGADAIVGHPLGFAAVLAAEKLGIPRVHAALQPVSLFSPLDPPLASLPSPFAALLGRGNRRWRVLYAAGRMISRPLFREVDATRARIGLPADSRHPLFQMADGVPTLALFSGVLLSPGAALPPGTIVTGFARHDRGEPGTPGDTLPAELATFLATGPAPVVFTLGSSAVFDARDFYTEGLAAVRALGRRAVLLCGPDGRNRPANLAGSDAMAVDYAPHSAVFPRAAAIVHQGGIGTTGQALAAGRPMLVMPCSHDQPDNAARCARLGIGRVLNRRDWRAPRVADALRALLGDAATAERARRIGERVRAEDGAAAAAAAIESVAARR